MSKSVIRLQAIKLRKQGISVREIAKKVGVAKSTASLWVRHIMLTPSQLKKLMSNSHRGWSAGRMLGSLSQKNKRLSLIETENESGRIEFSNLSLRDLKIAGLCLYWAEGSKKNRKVNFCNSDPKMIKFFITWINKVYQIPSHELSCYVGINEAHKNRERMVKDYWHRQTDIPFENFTKTSFKKYPLKKTFENFDEHYGTLSIQVRRPARIFYQIIGQIHGLSMAT